VEHLSDQRMFETVLNLAKEQGLSSYDASYQLVENRYRDVELYFKLRINMTQALDRLQPNM
jgi:hypothetical protein